MAKKIGVWIMGSFVLLFTTINLYNYFNKDSSGSATGMFVAEMPLGLNFSLLAFIAQWIVLLLIVIFAYSKFLKNKKIEDAKILGFVLPKLKSKAETNIDVFYHLLQEKKSLNVGTIAKAFGTTKEKALEWARILEEHGLVTIEYPAFSDADVKIKGYTEKDEKEKILENGNIKKKPETLELRLGPQEAETKDSMIEDKNEEYKPKNGTVKR